MIASRSILLLFAFLLAAVSAAPLHRRTCRHNAIIRPTPTAAPVSVDPTPEPTPSSEVPEEDEPEESETPSRPSSLVAVPSRSATPSGSKSAPAPSKTPDEPEEEEPETEQPSSGLMGKLLPVPVKEYWTTAAGDKETVSLSDGTLQPHHAMGALKRDYGQFAGKSSIHSHFPKGSYAYRGPLGGLSFYAPGPNSVDLTKAKEATFGYSVYFKDDFNYVLGGKLPGLYGGDSDDEAVGCSGGRRSIACFSARLMWRTGGAGEFYTYLPDYTKPGFGANRAQCEFKNSDCNPVYGASIGRGLFEFQRNTWNTVSERVRLNDIGEANGELELFVNGKSVIKIGGLILRAKNQGRIRGIQMQTFFGGSKTQFQAKQDEDAYFADLTVGISKYL